ncbi:hypothetical protein TSAR_016820 [Trichomalopsis sarcophagae]|uniref:Uncharacterized protein n=1 Tax=Trichomalopsis sarcophagae TaxID=543379 RepID=A0A232ES74_9HYME|nr:hypothetical protein TSAR_016820 [Trichomalopsis sarcophagae]
MTPTDLIWCYSKKVNSNIIPSWSGFMEQCTAKNENLATSKVVPLRFVNNPPSQFDTIFTVLLEADRECKSKGQKNCFVTFDQPLYFKAREILACQNTNDVDYNLSSVIVRLGGFNTVMSYIGAIGRDKLFK